jgi:hypothetical protein
MSNGGGALAGEAWGFLGLMELLFGPCSAVSYINSLD